jgi:hypothetical protein
MYGLLGTFLKGFSGSVADHTGWPMFFMYTAALSLPGLILLYFVVRRRANLPPAPQLAVE